MWRIAALLKGSMWDSECVCFDFVLDGCRFMIFVHSDALANTQSTLLFPIKYIINCRKYGTTATLES